MADLLGDGRVPHNSRCNVRKEAEFRHPMFHSIDSKLLRCSPNAVSLIELCAAAAAAADRMSASRRRRFLDVLYTS